MKRNFLYAKRDMELCIPFVSAIPLFTLFPKVIREKGKEPMFPNIYSSSLCSGKELEIEGMPSSWGMAKQVVVYDCDGILLYCKK